MRERSQAPDITVAPVRERGLKFWPPSLTVKRATGRSREGAWIEIFLVEATALTKRSRSREGAWIEIEIERLPINRPLQSLP